VKEAPAQVQSSCSRSWKLVRIQVQLF